MSGINSMATKFDQDNDQIFEINASIDQAQLSEFASTLKGSQNDVIRQFLTTLQARVDAVNTRAMQLRMEREDAAFRQGSVQGVSIGPSGPSQEIIKHNEGVDTIIAGINKFLTDRQEFLRSFAGKYMPKDLRAMYDRSQMLEQNKLPRVSRPQVGGNFALPTEGQHGVLRVEDNEKAYINTLVNKDVDEMTDKEVQDLVRLVYQKVGMSIPYERIVTAENLRAGLKAERQGAANAIAQLAGRKN